MSGRDTDHENLPKRRVERVEQSWEEPHSNPSLDGAQVEPVDSDQARAPKLFSTFPVSSRALAPNDPEAASSSIQMEGTASTTMHVHASSNIEEPTMFGTLGDGGKMTADDLYEAMRSGVEIELLEEGGLNTSLVRVPSKHQTSPRGIYRLTTRSADRK
ncbi:hypothetical protein DL93DRAFT_2073098 [Clavulina sp. PMI_390]|nr:hypothetical protein DL93DRAFT_2073098 [Clavulina sp. PMI_390]